MNMMMHLSKASFNITAESAIMLGTSLYDKLYKTDEDSCHIYERDCDRSSDLKVGFATIVLKNISFERYIELSELFTDELGVDNFTSKFEDDTSTDRYWDLL